MDCALWCPSPDQLCRSSRELRTAHRARRRGKATLERVWGTETLGEPGANARDTYSTPKTPLNTPPFRVISHSHSPWSHDPHLPHPSAAPRESHTGALGPHARLPSGIVHVQRHRAFRRAVPGSRSSYFCSRRSTPQGRAPSQEASQEASHRRPEPRTPPRAAPSACFGGTALRGRCGTTCRLGCEWGWRGAARAPTHTRSCAS